MQRRRRSSRPRRRRTSRRARAGGSARRPDRDAVRARTRSARRPRRRRRRRRRACRRASSTRARTGSRQRDLGIDRIDLGRARRRRARDRAGGTRGRARAGTCTPISHFDSTRASQPRGSSLTVLRSRVPPPGSRSSWTSATYQRSTPLSNTRSTTWRLPSIHSYGCSRHCMRMPATRCLPVVAAPAAAASSTRSRTAPARGRSRGSSSRCSTRTATAPPATRRAPTRTRRSARATRGTTGGAGCAVISAAVAVAQLLDRGEQLGRVGGPALRILLEAAARRARRPRATPRRTIASSRGGGSFRCARITPIWLSSVPATNGGRPAISANRQQPSA